MTTLAARPTRKDSAIAQQEILLTMRLRLMIVLLLLTTAIALIVAYIMYLGLVDTRTRITVNDTAFIPARGDIVDRNGVPLARTIMGYSIWVVPSKLINDPAYLADELARIFPDIPRNVLLAKLTSSRPGYIRRRALPEQVAAVNNIGDVGFEFPREQERLYPQMSLAAHVIGFANASNHGVTGAERAFDKRLLDPNQRANPMMLSIDARVQAILESELGSAVTNLAALGGAGVILNVHSGEILAMASYPTFNPNKILHGNEQARRNIVTHNLYELGSTFKPLTAAAAIDNGTVTNLARRYDASKPLEIAGRTIHDSHAIHRWLNLPEMLVYSSNIASARIADNLGWDELMAVLERLEFKNRAQIEINERAKPLWPKEKSRIATITVGYGHGMAVTLLHLANAYAAMVNGGILRPATLLKYDSTSLLPESGHRVFKHSTSVLMRQLMRLIVVEGTGKNADAPGLRVGGKTGSAEKPGIGGYRRRDVVATFAGAFPMDDPQYVIIAMIEEPKGNAYSSGQRTAGWTAAPVVRKVVMRIGPMLGILPDDTIDIDMSELIPLLWKPKREKIP